MFKEMRSLVIEIISLILLFVKRIEKVMEKIIISILIYCLPFTVFANEYFVSSSTGNDSNNGLS